MDSKQMETHVYDGNGKASDATNACWTSTEEEETLMGEGCLDCSSSPPCKKGNFYELNPRVPIHFNYSLIPVVKAADQRETHSRRKSNTKILIAGALMSIKKKISGIAGVQGKLSDGYQQTAEGGGMDYYCWLESADLVNIVWRDHKAGVNYDPYQDPITAKQLLKLLRDDQMRTYHKRNIVVVVVVLKTIMSYMTQKEQQQQPADATLMSPLYESSSWVKRKLELLVEILMHSLKMLSYDDGWWSEERYYKTAEEKMVDILAVFEEMVETWVSLTQMEEPEHSTISAYQPFLLHIRTGQPYRYLQVCTYYVYHTLIGPRNLPQPIYYYPPPIMYPRNVYCHPRRHGFLFTNRGTSPHYIACFQYAKTTRINLVEPFVTYPRLVSIHGLLQCNFGGGLYLPTDRFDRTLGGDADLLTRANLTWPNVRVNPNPDDVVNHNAKVWSHEWVEHGWYCPLTQDEYMRTTIDRFEQILPVLTDALNNSCNSQVIDSFGRRVLELPRFFRYLAPNSPHRGRFPILPTIRVKPNPWGGEDLHEFWYYLDGNLQWIPPTRFSNCIYDTIEVP